MALHALLRGKQVFFVVAAVTTLGIGSAAIGLAEDPSTPPPPLREAPNIGPSGQREDFTYVIPDIPEDPGSPVAHGDYRLVPYGYQGSRPSTKNFVDGSISSSVELAVVQASPLFAELEGLPNGYALAESQLKRVGATDVLVTLRFEGPGFPITVSRERIGQTPTYVFLHPSEGISIVEPIFLKDVPAILERPRDGSRFQSRVVLRFIQDGVETTVSARVDDPADSDALVQQVTEIADAVR